MNNHVEEQLSAYLDDELPLAESIDVKRHLDACVSCRTVLQELSSMQRNILAAYRSVLLPEDLEEHIRLAVFDENKSAYPSRRYAGLFSLPIISAILLCALLVLARAIFPPFFSLLFALLHAICIVVSAVPLLSDGLAVLSIAVALLSVWSLLRLSGHAGVSGRVEQS
ncbi:zf-HC2 domain-containing protein [Aneurinibacillus sp. Ricciae_BoGa-3]|uniref:anti-sigma factor family protein n=1 Tax=Aneurinibacillus sp. Ricciae_BoGa-3 TaxID=3022697 RepID=UPI0023413C16|nr:zf-HC2 domain-containing protein [Aneurinibacillus sp. Ricciae_BoGa-3]WCK53577.1 zf-HC2 domain-containing protein [Aneurinibacillus sp. Ricciae_BoGa-3]